MYAAEVTAVDPPLSAHATTRSEDAPATDADEPGVPVEHVEADAHAGVDPSSVQQKPVPPALPEKVTVLGTAIAPAPALSVGAASVVYAAVSFAEDPPAAKRVASQGA